MKKIKLLLMMAFVVPFVFSANTANAQILSKIKSKVNTSNILSSMTKETVTIGAIPTTIAEFDSLQAQLGTTPEGCIALQLVAMEMYHNDKEIGQACLEKNNTETNLLPVLRRLPEIFNANDTYGRPHIVATYFVGATVENGFNPDFPYAIKVRKNTIKKDEKSQMLKGYVKHYQVYSNGYDTQWRDIEVVQQKGDPYYRVSNCPSIYIQCKEVDWEAEQDYQGLKTTKQ